jgi:tetratricopeptide (TPR) repeat protein
MTNTCGNLRGRFWLLLFVVVCTCFGLCGCSRSAKRDRHLKRGQDLFRAQKYEKAEIEFLNVLRIESTNAVALRQLGLLYHEEGRLPRAYFLLQKANQLDRLDDHLRLRLAGIMIASRRVEEAREQAQAVLAHDPVNEEALMILADAATTIEETEALRERMDVLRPRAENKAGFHVALGMVHLRQRETNEALASCERAVSLDPKSSAAHIALANVYGLLKDSTKADFHFKSGADLAPLRSGRRVQYADFKLKSGDLPVAKALLQSMTNQAPDYVPPYSRLAEIAFLERRLGDAVSLTQTVLRRDPGNYDAMLLEGRINLAKGESTKALADLQQVVAAYPRAPAAHYQLALAQLMNKNRNQAMSSLRQAIALDPNHLDAILLLAELNIRKSDLSSAIASLNEVIKEHPHLAHAHLLLATAYRGRQDLEEAANVYENMSRMFARNPQPYYLWGQTLLLQQKQGEARKKFERAIEIAPDFLLPVEELVDLDIAENRFSTAEQRVQKYIDKFPKAPAVWLLLAKIYSAQKEHEKAEHALVKVIELDPAYQPGYLALARAYVTSNKHQLALERLNALLANSPNDVPALMTVGMIHKELKDYTAARDTYERLLRANPRFTPALNNLAYLYSEEMNQPDRAYGLARLARDLQPADPFVADTFAWILFKRGEYPWALTMLQESAEKLPKAPEILFHLAMTHYMLGEEQPARIAFQRALKPGQEFRGKSEAERRLALLSGAPPEAKDLPELERQLDKDPGDPILLSRIALLYERSNAFDKAVKTYNTALQHNPRNTWAMIKLAELHAGPLQNPSNAMHFAKEARALAPEDPQVAHILGRLAFRAADYRWSLSLLQESGEKLGHRPEVLYDLAWAWFSVGRIAEAQSALNRLSSVDGSFAKAADAKRFREINAALLRPETTPTAARPIREVLQQDPSHAPALFASGILAEQSGNASAARESYRKVVKRFPGFFPAHKRLAILLLAESPADDAAAYEHAVKAREALPDDPEVARTLGILRFRRKEYARASQLLQEATRQRPNEADTLYYLGMAHFHLKERTQSREALQQALSLNSNAVFAPQVKRILAQLK